VIMSFFRQLRVVPPSLTESLPYAYKHILIKTQRKLDSSQKER
jgi:hypothetical protein